MLNDSSKQSPKPNLTIKSLSLGIQAGAVIALYLFVIKMGGASNSIGLKYAGYILLGIFIAMGLNQLKKRQEDRFFPNGFKLGAFTSGIAALTLALINIVATAIDSTLAFQKYSVESINIPTALSVSGALLLEVFVIGIILTFILLQGLKPNIKKSMDV